MFKYSIVYDYPESAMWNILIGDKKVGEIVYDIQHDPLGSDHWFCKEIKNGFSANGMECFDVACYNFERMYCLKYGIIKT